MPRVGLVLILGVCVFAQQPATPLTPPAAQAPKSDALRRAFVDADGHRPLAISAAADQVNKEGTAGRTRLIDTLRSIAAVAKKPAAESTPAPAAGTTGAGGTTEAGKATPAPVEFAEEIKKTMAEVVAGPTDQAKAALAGLVDQQEAGAAALARLEERGKAIYARCVASFLRTKMATNAIYAGQFADLRDLQPEVSDTLLTWAQDPPKDAFSPDQFRTACVRALRDVLPTEQATDATRKGLRAVAQKAQAAGNQTLFLTTVCALHQYGEPTFFDKIKEGIEKQAASDDEQQKLGATNTLAELYYQLRQYDVAAGHYKTLVGLVEKTGKGTENLATTIYNTACSLSLAGKTDEAFEYLDKALKLGAKTRQLSKVMLDEDHDMNPLRSDERFKKLIEQHFGAAPATGK